MNHELGIASQTSEKSAAVFALPEGVQHLVSGRL
jgi:hypothetical protein